MRQLVCLLLALSACAPFARAEDLYVDPAAGDASNNGSKAAPWRTLEEVVSDGSLRHANPGDTILLRNGNHGRCVFGGDNEDFITIAADENCRPQISYLEITGGSKWKIRGLTVSASFADQPYKGVMLKFADGSASSEIHVEDCFVYSTLDTSEWSAKDWMEANSGITMGRHGTGHVVRNCYVMNTRFGINLCAEDSLCEGNVISHFSADGIRVTRDGQTVRHNVIRNIYVNAKDGDANHDDAIQCFLFNKGTGTVRNVTITENLVIMREDEQQKWPANMQAIGFFDGPLIGFHVEGNVINTSHWHGVSLYDAKDCTILNNVAYTQWTAEKLRPWVELGSKGKGEISGNTVKGNYAYSFKLKNDKTVEADDNNPPTEEIYTDRKEKLLQLINETYGEKHPTSSFRRVGLEQFRWIEGKLVERNGEKIIDAVEDGLGQDKLVLLYIYVRDYEEEAGDSKDCDEFEQEVLGDKEVDAQLEQCACVRFHLKDDLDREVEKRYGFKSRVPYLVMLSPDGVELWSGKPSSARKLLKELEDAHEELKEAEEE